MDNINLNQSGIYAITSPSGKRYVGQTLDFSRRWKRHAYDLCRGNHHSIALQRAYNKYGTLTYSVVELCAPEDLDAREQAYIDVVGVDNLYNVCPVAGSPMRGRRHTEEAKKKIGAASRGDKNPNWGKPLSDERKQRLRQANLGKLPSVETKRKISAQNAGKKQPRNTSGYAGVCFYKRHKTWKAMRTIKCRCVHLGTYPTAELANQARQNFDRVLRFYESSWSSL